MFRILLIMVVVGRVICTSSDTSGPICNTKYCNDISKAIRASMNLDKKPCFSFYDHTCNIAPKFPHPIRDGHDSQWLGTFYSGGSGFSLLTSFMFNCQRHSRMVADPSDLESLLSTLRTQAKMMQVNSYDWTDMFIYLTSEGFGRGQLFEIDTNFEDNKIELRPGNFSYLNTSDRRQKVERLMNMIEPSQTCTKMHKHNQLDKIDSLFETLLANAQETGSAQIDFNIDELNRVYSNIPWTKLLRAVSKYDANKPAKIRVIEPAYFDRLNRLVRVEDSRTLADVMLIDVLANYGFRLDVDDSTLVGLDRCFDLATKYFKPAVLSTLARLHIGLDKIEQMYEFFDYLKMAFVGMIVESNLISNATMKKNAIHRLLKIRPIIVCPRELLNETLLNDIYKGCRGNFGEPSLFEDCLKKINFKDWLSSDTNELLSEIETRDILEFKATRKSNTIYVHPSVAYQFIRSNNVGYLKYATVGSVLAHALSDMFKDELKTFSSDLEFNYKYEERSKHILKAYNCEKSRWNDINDQVGHLMAYKAYSNWLSMNSGELGYLPEMDAYNNGQMFWISLGYMFCYSGDDYTCEKIVNNGTSAPRLRVNQPLKNYIEFSRDFSCQAEQGMNPNKKYMLW